MDCIENLWYMVIRFTAKTSKSLYLVFASQSCSVLTLKFLGKSCLNLLLLLYPWFQQFLLEFKYWAVQWSWFAWVNALCNLLRKKSWVVAASLPGWFLCRHCFTLCITMEVEPRIAKQYKCHHCCACKKYCGKGMEGGKKCLCIVFQLTRRSQVRGKNAFGGILLDL